MKHSLVILVALILLALPSQAQKDKYKTSSICNCHRANMGLTKHDFCLYECAQDFNDSTFALINTYKIDAQPGWEVMTGMGALCIMVPPQDSVKLDRIIQQAIREGKLDTKRYLPTWCSSRTEFAVADDNGNVTEKTFSFMVLGRAQVIEGSRGDRHSVPVMDGNLVQRVELEPSRDNKNLYDILVWLTPDGTKKMMRLSEHDLGHYSVCAIGDHYHAILFANVIREGRLTISGIPREEACAVVDAFKK